MKVLVTGGAGYVGSISVERLVEAGHEVIVLDSLVTGHRSAVARDARLVEGTLLDGEAVERLLRDQRVDAVLHCAARSVVGQSVADPALYYAENVCGGVRLLDAIRAAGVQRLVFSSTAATYGEPAVVPIPEDAPASPMNPYGATKLAFEGAMRWYGEAYGMRCIALRYYNVAGASERNGEQHEPETHLIPNVLAAARGRAALRVFGTDYPTPDGTCIRDYIHVEDLADAHLAALELTGSDAAPAGLAVCNLGSGSGYTVLQVIETAGAVVRRPVPYTVAPRRSGDPPALVASNQRAAALLGWKPRRGSLAEMIGSAWRWLEAHPDGYGRG